MLTPTPTATTDGAAPGLLPPADTPESGSVASSPNDPTTTDVQATLRRRVLSPQTLISFGIAIAVLWFVVRRLDIDPGAIWAQIRQANLLASGRGLHPLVWRVLRPWLALGLYAQFRGFRPGHMDFASQPPLDWPKS